MQYNLVGWQRYNVPHVRHLLVKFDRIIDAYRLLHFRQFAKCHLLGSGGTFSVAW